MTLADACTGGFYHYLLPRRQPFLLCCLLPTCLASSAPLPLLLCCPLPACLGPPPPTPPSCHVVCHLPTVRQHCHRLVTASSYSPRLLSLSCPLPDLVAASSRTSPPPLLPQPPPCKQTKVPILAKKAMAFATAVAPLLVQRTLLELPQHCLWMHRHCNRRHHL